MTVSTRALLGPQLQFGGPLLESQLLPGKPFAPLVTSCPQAEAAPCFTIPCWFLSHSPDPLSSPLTTFPSVTCSECVLCHDGDCCHESKRCLLLGRKAMTNLDSILKSRDFTLPTKVCLVRAVVFPVVMYGCESWTVRKAEPQRIDAFELWCGEDS